MTSPCKGCNRRNASCHTICEEYKAFRAFIDEGNANRKILKEQDDNAVISALNRAKARKRGKRR